MKFVETSLGGVFVVELERNSDERGFFARSFCREEFAAHGLDPVVDQCNVSWSRRRGTLRGLHFQVAPHEEAKLVRCTRGRIYDVAIDLRVASPTRHAWFALELDDEGRRALYVPKGLAHGFQTLTDGCEVLYQMSAPFHADSARGVRWDDPAFGVRWPLPDPILSERDASYPLVDG